MLTITKNTLKLGLEKPLKILHITDNHIPFCCDEDPEGMRRQAAKRDLEDSVRALQEQMAYGEENCDLIVTQAQSSATRISKDSIRLQSKQDRGVPCVMAILDDVVTDLTAVDIDTAEAQ